MLLGKTNFVKEIIYKIFSPKKLFQIMSTQQKCSISFK